MKKVLSFYLAALMLTAPMAQAQTQNASGDSSSNANQQNTDATIGDLFTTASEEGKVANQLDQQIQSGWKNTAQQLNERIRSKLGPSLEKEINRYRLSYTIGLKNKNIYNDILSAEANYQIIAEPNFRDGEQVRRDVYTFGLGLNKGFAVNSKASASLGSQMQVRVTFSRVFTGPKAKYNSIMTAPISLTKVPLSADGIKENLKVGETVRVEILGHLGAGIGSGVSQKITAVGVGGGYIREALFMMDIYRHSETDTRIRLFGLKNRGTFNVSASATASPWLALVSGAGGVINDKLKGITDIGAHVNVSKSADLFHDFPIDTMMLDYLYKFSSRQTGVNTDNTAEGAINELLANVRKLGFVPLFSLFASEKDLAESMKARVGLSEKIAREDVRQGVNARVRHLFKGRITSRITTTDLGISGSKLIGSANQTYTHMKSFVRAEDALDRKSYYLLESATNAHDTHFLWGRSEEIVTNDLDILMKADENKKVTRMMDILSTTEIRDKHMRASELADEKKALTSTIPDSLQTPEVMSFLPTDTQTGAYLRYRYAFGVNAFAALNRMDLQQISSALYKFLDNHPKKNLMNLPKDFPETGTSYSEYVNNLAMQIYMAVGGAFTAEQRASALHLLVRDPIFQKYLIGDFFATLLPREDVSKLASLQMQFSSEQTPSKQIFIGQQKPSEIYNFVSFIRSVLNNRNYDLRLETQLDGSGQQILVTPEIHGFNVTVGEDEATRLATEIP